MLESAAWSHIHGPAGRTAEGDRVKQGYQTFDLVILGAGCAGLSLAARLAAANSSLHVTLVEARDRYTEDRTWCGWRLQPHFFEDCKVAEWNHWQLSRAGQILKRGSEAYPYEMLSAIRVYDKALQSIAKSNSTTLMLGVEATKLREGANDVEIEFSNGERVKARWVVDTRPRLTPIKHPWLWQSFVGIVAQMDGPEAEFERSLPRLMDFQSDTPGLIDFMYILPISRRSYLFEYTRFSARKATSFELESRLKAWLAEHAGSSWQELRRESGDLPMAKVEPPGSRRIFHAGTRGGSMRIATGYAFHNIQRWADECAVRLLEHGQPIGPHKNRFLDWMDELFLRVLQRPDVVPEQVMWSLFAESDPDALVRFLSGQPRLADYWPVVRGLPWSKFVGTAAGNLSPLKSAR
jgi:lycopene beta-cyclase